MPHDGFRAVAGIAPRNLTLAALPQTLIEKLAPLLNRVDLPQHTVLVKSDSEISWIYFLERGMASVSSLDLSGTPLEVGIIGREGIVGVQALLGQRHTQNMVVMQGSGDGFRVRADALRGIFAQSPELISAVHAFVFTLLEQTTQLVLCNRLHGLESRLARWLLMAADCMETSTLHLTQEYIAEMLGVGRPAVTIAAGILQRGGLVTYSRGQLEILNREKLRRVACECYDIIDKAIRSVYPSRA